MGMDGPTNGVPTSAKEFILSTYNARVAVLCSPAAETVVSKNNLKFTQLLMPFTKVGAEGNLINKSRIKPMGLGQIMCLEPKLLLKLK
jgi:hypothetical protein